MSQRIILIFLVVSILNACSTVAPSNKAESSQASCKNRPSQKHIYTSKTEKTNDKVLVWSIPTESEINAVFGIQKLSFDKPATAKIPYLDIKINGKAKNIEFEAEVDKVSQVKVYEAEPLSTAVATTILLGLPLLFMPGKITDEAFGCTDVMSSKLIPSEINRTPTGKEQWVDYSPNYITLRFVGINAAPIEKTLSVKDGIASFRLEDYVSWKNASNQLNIKVTCLSCKNLKDEESGILYSESMDIALDVNQIRVAEAANKKKQEDAAIMAKQKADEDRAKAADRAAQAKSEAIAKAQAAEQKFLDQYKEKCSNLGFKVGTDAFGKCVLQLTK